MAIKYKINETIRQREVEVLSIFTAILTWQFIAVVIVKDNLFLPSFTDVLFSFFKEIESGAVFIAFSISLMHFAIGLVSAFIIGIPVGIMMGWFKSVNLISDPLIEIIRPIPPLAWIPFAIIWFGLTPQSAGFVIFMGAVFPIIINTFTGFKGVQRVHVETAKVLGCMRDRDLIRYVALPSALPSIVAGLRIGMGVGWMCLVAAEMFGVSSDGLGYKIWFHFHLHNMDFVLVYMLLVGFLGLSIDRIFRYCTEKYLLQWRSGVMV
jgi:NitT/TauT family transport system permease protein